MPDGLNKVILIGNLEAEPEMKFTQNGSAVTNFRLAVSRVYGTDEERRGETSWFTIVTWNKLAEAMGQQLLKGSRVYVEGRLSTRSWDGPDGQKRYATEVVANHVLVLERGQGGQSQEEEFSYPEESFEGAENPAATDRPEGLNRVMLIGNLGADPEMRYTGNGTAVTNLRVASSRSIGTPEGRREETEWFSVVAWNKLAEILGQYAQKGRKVYAEGRLTTRSWDGPDGQKRYRTEVVADQVLLLDRAQGAPFGDGGGMGFPSGGDLDPDDLPFE
jgi:single-strand DNA-binding protein